MTIKLSLAGTLAAAGMLLASQPSQADTLHLNVGGEFYNATCGYIVNGGLDVDLGRHNLDIFNRVGASSPWVEFNITSAGCNAGITQVLMTWRGAADANNAATFATTGTAKGVGIWMQQTYQDEGGFGTLLPNLTYPRTPLQIHYFRAALHQTLPTVTEGTASAAITLDITYN